jgi:plastocyanin
MRLLHAAGLLTSLVWCPPVVTPPADAAVEIRTFQFTPDSLRVKAGTRVVWTNRDAIEHTVTAGMPEKPSAAFSGTMKEQRRTFAVTFSQAGKYPYFCERHAFMRGAITVIP